ncbi:response regulator [Enterobacteriaceae bacterium 155047]|uniref:response regulator n=1 Tax=Huaxiibacter chinensis TaxID=2899785 RepID=UPI0007DA828E|nr:response regulator [Huaxiibacter chinensis]ANG93829.1 response regulator [Lelliottia amnigena]MCG5046033.1 response regulator [Huaxiibacter chinensis]
MQLTQRIVVVDDERSVRNGLTNLLQSEGYLTDAFESAESLLCDEAAMAKAALFIIDVQLKGMNGFELFVNLTRRLENPPGIIISGDGEEGMLQQALDLGAIAFMPKPIEIDTLFEYIRDEFSSKAAP